MRYPRTLRSISALLAASAAMTTSSSAVAAQLGALPGGWHASNVGTGDYSVGSDVSRRPGGTGMISGYIRATVKNPTGVAALTQAISAAHLRGQRVRVTGYVRRSADSGYAQLFLRLEGRGLRLAKDHAATTEFVPARNSEDHRGWVQQSIVVDVPEYSTGLRIGFVSMGAEEAWLDDVRFELVNKTVSLIGTVIASPTSLGTTEEIAGDVKQQESAYQKLAMEFVNLDFESLRLSRR